MTTPRSNIVRLRLTDLEKQDWSRASGGTRKMSEWIRAQCNLAVEREHAQMRATLDLADEILFADHVLPSEPIPNRKPVVVVDAIAREQEQTHRGSRSLSAAEAHGADSSVSDRKAGSGLNPASLNQCSRWMYHRPGVYCGACKRVIGK